MSEYSELYEFKKKFATIAISLLFLLFAIFFNYLRTTDINYKISDTKDVKEIVFNEKSEELSAYINIDIKPVLFAKYHDKDKNAFYMIEDGSNIYIVYGEEVNLNGKVTGVTKKINNKFKNTIIEAYEERYNDKVNTEKFSEKFGYTYLDTTADKYEMTTNLNTLVLIFVLMSVVTFVYGFFGAIIYGIRHE